MSRRAANVTGDAAVPGDAGPDYIALVREYLWALHFRLNDPFWRFKFGAKSRRAAAAYAAWDGAMEGIARGVVKSAPPEYTIAGALLLSGVERGWLPSVAVWLEPRGFVLFHIPSRGAARTRNHGRAGAAARQASSCVVIARFKPLSLPKSNPPPPTCTLPPGHLLKAVDPATGKPLTLTQLKSEMSIFYIAVGYTLRNAS